MSLSSLFPASLNLRYLEKECIGSGGGGRVYRAEEREGGQEVAVKVVNAEQMAGTFGRQSILRELNAMAKLQHRNIIQLIDFEIPREGESYFVMEYLGGGDMGRWRQQWPGWTSLILRFSEILSALAYAHARGVIHCDLKPENILFGTFDQGSLKIADFGISHLRKRGSLLGNQGAWRAEEVAGTPAYMAPEQVGGYLGSFGPWTDFYSIGVILYEIIAGRLPFENASDASILLKHLNESIPELSLREGVLPLPGLEVLLFRLLAKDPWERPLFASQIRDDLLALLPRARLLDDLEVQEQFSFSSQAFSPKPFRKSLYGLHLKYPPIVGREEMISGIVTLAQHIIGEQRTHIVLLEGTAGIGKSSVAIAAKQRLEEKGLMQAWHGIYQTQDPEHSDGLFEAIRGYYLCSGLDLEQTERAIAKRLGKVGALDAWELRGLLDILLPDADPDAASRSDKAWLDMLVRILREACQRAPVCLLLEDIQHQMDGALLSFFSRILSEEGIPCLIITTLREPNRSTDPTGRQRQILGALGRMERVQRVEVGPLSSNALKMLLIDNIGLPENRAERIIRESRGNPFLALQQARASHELSKGDSSGGMKSPFSPPNPHPAESREEFQSTLPVTIISPLNSQRWLVESLAEITSSCSDGSGEIAFGMLALLAPVIQRDLLDRALNSGWPERNWSVCLEQILHAAHQRGLLEWGDEYTANKESVLLSHEALNRLLIDRLTREGWFRRAHLAAAAALEEFCGEYDLKQQIRRIKHLVSAGSRRSAWRLAQSILNSGIALGRFEQLKNFGRKLSQWLNEWNEPIQSARRSELRCALIRVAIGRGDHREIEALFEVEKEQRRAGDFTQLQAPSFLRLSAAYLIASKEKDVAGAIEMLQQLHQRLQKGGSEQEVALVALDLGNTLLSSDPNRAEGFFKQAAEVFYREPFLLQYAAITQGLGQVEAARKNDEKALVLYQNAFTIYLQFPFCHGLAELRHRMAKLFLSHRKTDLAKEALHAALMGYEMSGDSKGLADSLRLLARIHRTSVRPAEAIKELKRAIQLFELLEDPLGSANCILDLASLEREHGRLKQAWEHTDKAMGYYQKHGDDRGSSDATILLGNILLDMGKSQQAMAQLETAQGLSRRLGYWQGVLFATLNLGRTLMLMGQMPRAHQELLGALELALDQKDNARAAIAIAYDMLVLMSMGTPFELSPMLNDLNTHLPAGLSTELGLALEQLSELLQLQSSPATHSRQSQIHHILSMALECFTFSHQNHAVRRVKHRLSALPLPHAGQ